MKKESKKFYIGESEIHNKGLLTVRNIKKGETIFIIKGKLVKFKVKTKKDSLLYPNWFGISQGVWIDPQPPGLFINHSCDANSGIHGRLTLKAIRNIKKGEEITIDYSTIEIDPLWEMKCCCGSKKCRKIVRSINYLPEKIFKQYYPFISTNFKNFYIKNKHMSVEENSWLKNLKITK